MLAAALAGPIGSSAVVDVRHLAFALEQSTRRHEQVSSLLSLSQATECGTLYSCDEIAAPDAKCHLIPRPEGLPEDSTLIGPCPASHPAPQAHRHSVHGFGPRHDARGYPA